MGITLTELRQPMHLDRGLHIKFCIYFRTRHSLTVLGMNLTQKLH